MALGFIMPLSGMVVSLLVPAQEVINTNAENGYSRNLKHEAILAHFALRH
jgi:hypothetical protein